MEKKEFKKKFNLDKEMIQVEYNNKVETTLKLHQLGITIIDNKII